MDSQSRVASLPFPHIPPLLRGTLPPTPKWAPPLGRKEDSASVVTEPARVLRIRGCPPLAEAVIQNNAIYPRGAPRRMQPQPTPRERPAEQFLVPRLLVQFRFTVAAGTTVAEVTRDVNQLFVDR